MNTGDLIEELEGLGVQLWAESGQLRFRAPKGVMTPERLATVKAHKQQLLARLGGSAAVVADPASRHEPFPLTDVQSAYLLGRSDAFGYGGVACHGYFEVAFAELDPARLESAWQHLVDRHDMLRAVVDPAGYQRVLPGPRPYRIRVQDLRGEPTERLDEAIEAARAELSHRVYDPQQWPLFELRVTRATGRDVLHVSIDLLVADYASIQLLLAELDREYTRPGDPAPPLEVSFRDVVLAERAARQGPGYEADRSWWHDRVDTLPPAPELPLAEQPEQAPPRFVRHHTRLDRVRWAQLRRRATERDLSPAGALLAGYAEVVGSWSGRPGFTLNLTLLNRPPLHPQVGGLVGDFTSVTLLAVEPESGAPFAERAATLQRRLWTDLDHRRCSGIEVVREVARRRGAEAALMPVVFTSTVGLAEAAADAGEFTGSGELVHGVSQTPQVWIDCQVMEHRGELLINWDVRDGVFPDGLIEDMFAAYQALIGRLATTDGAWAQRRPVPLPAAQTARRAEVNATATAMTPRLLHQPLVDQARRNPDRIAVIAADRTLTYSELLAEAQVVAARLLAAGTRRAEPVAVVMDKGWEHAVAVLGVLLAGAPYLPIDTNQPPARRASMLSRAAVRHVLTQPWLREGDWPDGLAVHEVLRRPAHAATNLPAPPTELDDLAYVIYTSGSTGAPKGVMISHRGAVNTVLDVNDRFEVTAEDRVLGLANLGFDLSVYDIFGVLGAGGALVLPDPRRRGDPSHWAELAAEHRVTIWNSVPAQMQMLSDYLAGVPEEDRPHLRLALLSGDWIPVTLPDAIRALQPQLKVVSLGGATEASIWSIYHPIDKVEQGWRSIPYGVPLANQTFDVFRDDLTPCPDWLPGELYIGGTGVALGYLGDQARTAERFRTHPATGARLYRTGDIGRYRPDGAIEFLGRQDDQVKILGHRIELAEVDAALVAFPAVGSAAVVVRGADPLQRRLEAFVEPAHRAEPPAVGNTARRVGEAAATAAAAVAAGVDPAAMAAFVARLDRAALDAMLWALRQAGLFGTPQAGHGLAEVLATAGVAPRHHRLVRRWLRALAGNGLLAAEPRGWRLPAGSEQVQEPDWSGVFEAAVAVGPDHGAELVRYLHTSAQRLPELLRDEVDPLALLFPEGRLEVAESAYRDNLISRYLNRALATALREIAHEPGDRPLAVLEVGGGVGGTTAELVDAVAGLDVDYLFTDVSTFFLNEARQRFGEQARMRYGLFDLNADPWAQGMAPNSFDVVVCANVLHNARHADEALRRLCSLLRPGGWLLFIEATRDSYPLMASMEFKEGLTDFADERQATEHTFHTRQSWLQRLAAVGAELVCCLPGPDDVLGSAGQHAFAARVKTDRARVAPGELADHLAGQLPGYMLPARIHVVDALPLTDNGKVDRRALERWTGLQDEPEARTGPAPQGEFEQQLAQLWTDVLGAERIGRDEDFYAAGGDSLLAAKLVGRVRDELPGAAGHSWDVLLRQLMRTPTVAGLAAWLQAGAAGGTALPETAGTGPGTLVDLGGTGAQDDPVLVLVHDGSGTLAPYRALLPALTGHGRVVGLAVGSAQELLRLDPDALIAKLAADYAAELAGTVPGPYHLVGYCMGGLLAAEVARNLTETGLEVAGLTVISGYRVPYLVEDDLLVEYAFARTLGVDPASLGYPADEATLARALQAALAASPDRLAAGCLAGLNGDPQLGAVAGALRELSNRPAPQRLAALTRAAGERLGHESAQLAWGVFDHCLRAVTRHPAQPYAGDITFLRQQGGTHFLPGLREDMTAFWQDVCLGELRIVDIPGDHFSCLDAPHAAGIAAAVAATRGAVRR